MSEAFDYVIAGAGTAGCVLANRLSADAGVTVALLEAGPPDDDPAIHVPAMVAKAIGNPRQSWGYQTVPQAHVDNRVLPVPRGRVLGGSSSINGMVYFRGHPREYDEWQQPGWRYADLLPYFQRLENYEAAHTPLRRRGGPVNVIDIAKPNPLVGRFLAAADSLGLPRCADFNGGDPQGFGPRQAAIRQGRRESGVTAYLNPARRRPNLKIVTGALVTRVLFDGRRATGVEIERDGARSTVTARREVIVACGAYGSPQLLQLSGVGDAAALQALGIAPRLDLPAVGKNLHDHPAASIAVRTANTDSYGLSWRTVPRSFRIAAQYLLLRTGPLASNVFEANGFMRSKPDLDRPDLQIIFMPAHRNASGHWLPRGHGYGIIFVNLRPASRGSVGLTSNDPHAKPAIDFNFLAHPGDIDVLVKGFEVARSILSAPSFAPLAGRETSPGPEVRERGEVAAHIRRSLVTVHHPCGTCRLGDVVDGSLHVKGIDALRVVDASIIPTVIAGNSNIPVNAVAERAADLILGKVQ
ncbi:MAG TPA: GMC family oxidoreductase N-terminal domain-containing protein [Steroidobacteraceae bacterium]|nr:GMC family oxidoreductase N-terminal domain-containing protein [Steroidobacteraceae bacterium]